MLGALLGTFLGSYILASMLGRLLMGTTVRVGFGASERCWVPLYSTEL